MVKYIQKRQVSKMNKTQIMDSILEKNNQYFLTSQAIDNGISKTYVAEYIKKNGLVKLAHGVYSTEDAWPDLLYVIHLRNKEVVFSHESALAIHGLTAREAPGISVTVNRSYNATHLRKEGCRVYTVKPELYEMGITEGKTFYGNTVRVYDIDRTICDIIKHKKKVDIQTYQYAIKEYMKSSKKNINNLMKYANALGVENTVRLYTEVML